MTNHDSLRGGLLREMLEAAPDAMIVLDRAGCIVVANELAENLFGYQRSELEGQSLAMLMPLRFREGHMGNQARFFANPGKRPMGSGRELVALRKDGEEFPVEVSLSPLETSEGVVAVSALRDVTERKRAEAKLERTNLELQNALDLVKRLTGCLPICSFCKKVRDGEGRWKQIETYIHEHSEAEFTHGICPECGKKHYGLDLEADGLEP